MNIDGMAAALFTAPAHEYTRELPAAIPGGRRDPVVQSEGARP